MAVLADALPATGYAGTAGTCPALDGAQNFRPQGHAVTMRALLNATASNIGFGHRLLSGRSGKSDTVFDVGPFSYKQAGIGFLLVRVPVRVGVRTISARVKMADATMEPPELRIRANLTLGVVATTLTATATTEWQTLGPVSLECDTTGVLFIELWNTDPGFAVWFDTIARS